MDNIVIDLKEKDYGKWTGKNRRDLMNMVLKLRVSYKAEDFQRRTPLHGIKYIVT
jgi:hypothetical protein